VRSYIVAVFDSDKEVSQLRAGQAIVTHLETFPVQRAQAACRRAHHFGCFWGIIPLDGKYPPVGVLPGWESCRVNCLVAARYGCLYVPRGKASNLAREHS